MNESQKSLLIQIASEMVCGKGMPPEYCGDWEKIGKTVPLKTRWEIERRAKEAKAQCHNWSKRLMEILHGEPE